MKIAIVALLSVLINAALLKSSEMRRMPLQMQQTFHSMWGVGNKRVHTIYRVKLWVKSLD